MKTLFKITAFFLMLGSCQAIKMTPYDPHSYLETIALKNRTMAVMAHSNEAYALHQQEIDALLNGLNLHNAYEKNKPDNTVTTAMWAKLTGTDQALIPKFISLWKQKGQLNPAFTQESVKQINEAFDQIIILENAKQK